MQRVAAGQRLVTRQVGQRAELAGVAPAQQPAQFCAIFAQRVGRAPGAATQEERQRVGVVMSTDCCRRGNMVSSFARLLTLNSNIYNPPKHRRASNCFNLSQVHSLSFSEAESTAESVQGLE